tara:strand:- start:803 stop:1003 length:201 start_codon:yes stop_codon:yes gene_type:complete
MLKVLLLSIGLVLVFEGLIYFLFAGKMVGFLEQISKIDPQIIKTISVFAVGIGVCLIYFTLRFYVE